MRVLVIVQQTDAGPGVFDAVLAGSGHEIEEWRPDLRPGPSAAITEYDATLVFGGAMHVDQEAEHPWLRAEKELLSELCAREGPVLGVCLGAQLLAEAAGGSARLAATPEIGWHEVRLETAAATDPLLGLLPRRFAAFQWHSYEIEPPAGAAVLARSDCCLQAFRAGRRAWGVQFHAEVMAATVTEWMAKDGEGKGGELSAAGLDPEEISAETARRAGASGRLGATLCRRFLALAERATA